jgi:hypothetical protein
VADKDAAEVGAVHENIVVLAAVLAVVEANPSHDKHP